MKSSAKETARKTRHARIRKVVQGTAERPRLVVFKSLKTTYAQLVDDQSRKTLLSASSPKAKKGTKTEKAKEVGKEIAAKAKEKSITKVVFDRNGYKYHGRVKAVAEGAREGGLQF
jgi:large subunit ribosomal protein L18